MLNEQCVSGKEKALKCNLRTAKHLLCSVNPLIVKLLSQGPLMFSALTCLPDTPPQNPPLQNRSLSSEDTSAGAAAIVTKCSAQDLQYMT